MKQFWFTIKKTKKTHFYKFGLADKKFSVDVKLFRKILDICPRVPNEDFVAPPSEEYLLTFLIELGYKGLISPKKSKGKGSQDKKSTITPKPASVEVSDESDPEPTKRQTDSRRKSTRRRPSGIAFRDTSSVSKKKSPDQSQKLKGIQTMTAKEQVAADRVPDELTVILITSSKGTGTKPWVPDEVKGSSEAEGDSTTDWGSKEVSEYSDEEHVDEEIEWLTTDEKEEKKDDDEDDKSINHEKTDDDEETDDEFVHGDEYVHNDVDEEMKDAEVTKTRKDSEKIIDVEKTYAEKTEITKGDLKQAGKLPLTSFSLSVSSGFEVTHIQSPSILTVPVLVIPEPIILSPIHEIPSVTPATTLLPPPSFTNLTPVLQQIKTPIPTPPITTVAPVATTVPDLLL
ncbi:hypothetical protein Tco_1539994, partial [Tanacetum coccineum]